jgi:hypothetical protein
LQQYVQLMTETQARLVASVNTMTANCQSQPQRAPFLLETIAKLATKTEELMESFMTSTEAMDAIDEVPETAADTVHLVNQRISAYVQQIRTVHANLSQQYLSVVV